MLSKSFGVRSCMKLYGYSYNRNLSSAIMSSVKVLREKTGAPMMDCKRALEDSSVNGDITKAIDWLRAKGVAKASSVSADRLAAEGLIGMKTMKSDDGFSITLVEINSETDFVARNKEFQQFVVDVVHAVSKYKASSEDIVIADVMKLPTQSAFNKIKEISIADSLGEAVSRIREKIVISRVMHIHSADVLGSYMHGRVAPEFPTDVELGRSVGVVELCPIAGLAKSGDHMGIAAKRLAMHIVAVKPTYLTLQDIPQDLIAKETSIFREQYKSGNIMVHGKGPAKSPDLITKIVTNKVNKRLAEMTLLEQNHLAEEGGPVVGRFLDALGVTVKRVWNWAIISK